MEIIEVVNIKCGGCASSIERALNSIEGVKQVQVDINTQKISVEGKADKGELVAVLHKLGYPLAGENSLILKTKSYVSCAIGNIKG